MNNPKFALLLVLAVLGELLPPNSLAQGTTYLANVNSTPGATIAVGSHAWVAQGFFTGTNLSVDYALNSIQLRITHVPADSGALGVSLYAAAGVFPGAKLGDFASLDPVVVGLNSFQASGITLSPYTFYFIIVNSTTPVSGDAFSLGVASSYNAYNAVDGWRVANQAASANGLTWVRSGDVGPLQFAINATAIPEPSALALLAFGGGWFLWQRQRRP